MKLIIEKLKSCQYRESTANMYLGVWQQFNKFLMRLDKVPTSWEDRATLFVAYLIEEKGLQSSTIKSYISAIKRTLVDDDKEWDDSKILIRSLTRACRMINDTVRTRLAIHCSLLEMLLFELQNIFAGQWYLEIMYKAIFVLGYYGLMRIGEMTESPHVLKAKDVFIGTNKRKLLLVLHSSKTHVSGTQEIKIVANKDEKTGSYRKRHFCPMAIIDIYNKAQGPYLERNEQFFIFRDRSPVKPVHVATVLKQAITQLELDSRLYGTHSLRIGRSSDLIKYGYTIEEVKRMGRWKSTAVYKYIRNCE